MTNKIVDPSLYDRDYYLTDCGGFREYAIGIERGGHPRYQEAVRLADIAFGMRVLDIGCGRGELSFHCARAGCRVMAVDYSEAACELTRETFTHLPEEARGRVSVACVDMVTHTLEDRFDIIFMLDIIEHLYDWQLETLFKKLAKLLLPGGRIIMRTPNAGYEQCLYPLKKTVSLPFIIMKQLSRIARGKKRFASFGEWQHETFKFFMHRNDLIDEMHVNVKTPGQLRKMLAPHFDADVWCSDHSKNLISLLTQSFWGREITVIARPKDERTTPLA